MVSGLDERGVFRNLFVEFRCEEPIDRELYFGIYELRKARLRLLGVIDLERLLGC